MTSTRCQGGQCGSECHSWSWPCWACSKRDDRLRSCHACKWPATWEPDCCLSGAAQVPLLQELGKQEQALGKAISAMLLCLKFMCLTMSLHVRRCRCC